MKISALDPTVKDILSDMDDAVDRANHVIRGLTEYATPLPMSMQHEDVNAIVQASLSLVRHELLSNQITAEVTLADNLPTVEVDRVKLEQVLVNLITNAVQAIGRNGTLYVRSAYGPVEEDPHGEGTVPLSGEGFVRITVEDDGPGIPEKDLGKVFDVFFTTKAPGVGAGLGLAVSKSILDMHGAGLAVENREEGGARFIITFLL